MEFIVEKIGMSRTVSVPSTPVTLLKVVNVKVCEATEDGTAIVAYSKGKKKNKSIDGQQKKYDLSAEFNNFATLALAAGTEKGDQDVSVLGEAKRIKTSFKTKGRGFAGVIKRWNFAGGPGGHGSRFHRAPGSIGNAEWPGRVQKGRKMPGHYGVDKVTVQNEVLSFDSENMVLVVKGSVSGANGAMGRIKVTK